MAVEGATTQTLLVCYDWDETIVNGHCHNTLRSQRVPSGAATHEHADNLIRTFGFKNEDLTCESIKTALRNNHLVAITSYTAYPEIIPHMLQRLGLSAEEVAKIKIISGFPTLNGTLDPIGRQTINANLGKELHIRAAQQWASQQGHTIGDEAVILIDDSQNNVDVARRSKHQAIKAPRADFENSQFGDYLFQLEKIVGPYDIASVESRQAARLYNHELLGEVNNFLNTLYGDEDPYQSGDENYNESFQFEHSSDNEDLPTKPDPDEDAKSLLFSNVKKSTDEAKIRMVQEVITACQAHIATQPTVSIHLDELLKKMDLPVGLQKDLLAAVKHISRPDEKVAQSKGLGSH